MRKIKKEKHGVLSIDSNYVNNDVPEDSYEHDVITDEVLERKHMEIGLVEHIWSKCYQSKEMVSLKSYSSVH